MKRMNIAIIGYGNMGREIEKISKAKGIAVQSIIDTKDRNATHKEINDESMHDVDVCIDFTNSNTVIGNIKKISKFKKNIAVGTTGWYDKISEAKTIVKKNEIGLIYAQNFSIGVNVFLKIIENAAKIINNIDDYDVYGYRIALFKGEYHWHKHTNRDELFYVLKGEIVIQMKPPFKDIRLLEGEIAVVPKGAEHCAISLADSYVLMFEPYELKSGGD